MPKYSAPENCAVACAAVNPGSVSRRMVICQRRILGGIAGEMIGFQAEMRWGRHVKSLGCAVKTLLEYKMSCASLFILRHVLRMAG